MPYLTDSSQFFPLRHTLCLQLTLTDVVVINEKSPDHGSPGVYLVAEEKQ